MPNPDNPLERVLHTEIDGPLVSHFHHQPDSHALSLLKPVAPMSEFNGAGVFDSVGGSNVSVREISPVQADLERAKQDERRNRELHKALSQTMMDQTLYGWSPDHTTPPVPKQKKSKKKLGGVGGGRSNRSSAKKNSKNNKTKKKKSTTKKKKNAQKPKGKGAAPKRKKHTQKRATKKKGARN